MSTEKKNVSGSKAKASKRLKSIQDEIPFVELFLQTSLKACRDVLEGILQYEHLYGPWRFNIIEDAFLDASSHGLGASAASGAIVFAQSRESAKFDKKFSGPLVLIDPVDEYFPDFNLESSPNRGLLKYDSVDVGQAAAQFLLEHKFPNYAYVDDATGFNWSKERGESFCRAIREAGKNCFHYETPPLAKRRSPEKELGRLVNWLVELPKPIAIFASRDVRARQLLNIFAAEGISVPHQAAVLGVDNDLTICRTTWPQLSSVQLESTRAGFRAAETLATMMRADRLGETVAIETRYVKQQGAVVEERASTDSVCVDNSLVSSALEYIKINIDKGVNVKSVADALCVSRRQLETVFKKHLKQTIISEINRIRCQKACSLLANTDLSVVEIAALCGYDNASYMGKVFKKTIGQTALAFRRRNRNLTSSEGNRSNARSSSIDTNLH